MADGSILIHGVILKMREIFSVKGLKWVCGERSIGGIDCFFLSCFLLLLEPDGGQVEVCFCNLHCLSVQECILSSVFHL